MKIFRIYNPSENKYAHLTHRVPYRNTPYNYNVKRDNDNIFYDTKGKTWRTSVGVKLFLGKVVAKPKWTDYILDADILKGLIVVECDLDKRTFTDYDAFEFYTKKKKVITDPNIKQMILSSDLEMSKLGIELFEASLKTKKKK
jgi:hypothetical protein